MPRSDQTNSMPPPDPAPPPPSPRPPVDHPIANPPREPGVTGRIVREGEPAADSPTAPGTNSTGSPNRGSIPERSEKASVAPQLRVSGTQRSVPMIGSRPDGDGIGAKFCALGFGGEN